VTLRVTVTVWTDDQGSFPLTGACSFEILPPDPARLALRLAEIAARLRSAEPAADRLELLRSVAALDHPDLIPVLLQAVRDPDLMVFHTTARRRAAQLGEQYGRGTVVEHLRCCGSRYDSMIFDTWSDMGVRLTADELSLVREAGNPWIRLFSLETFRDQGNRRGAIDSLRAETGELRARAERLER
jgi:hypothetical protein